MDIKAPHLRYKNQTRRERTWTIHFIAIEKTVKGLVVIALSIKLLSLFGSDVHGWASDFVTRHGIDLTNRYVHASLEKLVGFGNTQVIQFSIVGVVYAVLLFTEGIGLWLQKRWAEYLTTFATALFIPIELYELYEKFTWVRIAIIALNIFVVWYLWTRMKDEKVEAKADKGDSLENYNVRVKICGITNLEDAQHAIEAGADELGLNFYRGSKRYISPKAAREIVHQLPTSSVNVGVFVNESISEVLKIAKLVGLDGIQLHGDEDNQYIRELKGLTDRFVIKAFRISSAADVIDAIDWDMDYALFDSYSPNERGGTGESFDWENAASDIYVCFPNQAYLAGGLTPENVAEAVQMFGLLHAVDVASGVESAPGKKDPEKVAAFIKAAKEAI